ncbi:MAG: acylphosphatase [Syntrophorhabdaceae bacterium]|nr:acylphosphatase [Syntrophorhabdaceae bacterium]
MKRVHIYVTGIVQGVFFRHNTARKATALNIKGWVRNLPDGRVEILCEGREEDLEELIRWSKKGPPGAYVEDVEVEWQEFTNEFKDFRIVR